MSDLVTGAGFRLTRLENYFFHRPRAVGGYNEGAATKTAGGSLAVGTRLLLLSAGPGALSADAAR